jgi:hypothetical protein
LAYEFTSHPSSPAGDDGDAPIEPVLEPLFHVDPLPSRVGDPSIPVTNRNRCLEDDDQSIRPVRIKGKNLRESLKSGHRATEGCSMMSHEMFEYESRRTPRRSLRIAPFIVLVALAAYATVVIAALTAPGSAESGTPAGGGIQVVDVVR